MHMEFFKRGPFPVFMFVYSQNVNLFNFSRKSVILGFLEIFALLQQITL